MTTDNVVDILENQPHRAGHLRCHSCGTIYIGVAPLSSDHLWKECPFCEIDMVQFCDLPLPKPTVELCRGDV